MIQSAAQRRLYSKSGFCLEIVKQTAKHKLVFVTAPDFRTARKLARAALQSRAAACANLLPGIQSHYWWKGKIERATEVLLLFKTTATRLDGLEDLILERHPYDTPEFIVVDLSGGNQKYLEWLGQNCATPHRPAKRRR